MSLGRKKHSPRFRRGTRTSPSQSWTAVVLFLVRMSSRAPRSQVVVRRLGGLACTIILQLHQGSILQAAEAVACPLMHSCIPVSRMSAITQTKSQFPNRSKGADTEKRKPDNCGLVSEFPICAQIAGLIRRLS